MSATQPRRRMAGTSPCLDCPSCLLRAADIFRPVALSRPPLWATPISLSTKLLSPHPPLETKAYDEVS
jgi:hypothetical protein